MDMSGLGSPRGRGGGPFEIFAKTVKELGMSGSELVFLGSWRRGGFS